MASAIAIALLLILCCGIIPARLGYFLVKSRRPTIDSSKQHESIEKHEVIKFITAPYQKSYYYWLYLEYLERAFMGSFSVFYSRSDQNYSWTMFVAIMFLLLLQQVTAYRRERESWSKMVLIICMIGVAGTGIMQIQPCAMADCDSLSSVANQWENVWLVRKRGRVYNCPSVPLIPQPCLDLALVSHGLSNIR